MKSHPPSNSRWFRSACLRFSQGTAFFVFLALVLASSTSNAASLCSYAFQNETRPELFDFVHLREKPLLAIHPETLKSLNIIKFRLHEFLSAAKVSKAKELEAFKILEMIRSLTANQEKTPDQVFEIAARYSILISHGYKGNLKDELVWYQDIFNRKDDFGPKTLESLEQLETLMKDSGFVEFRDRYLDGLMDLYGASQKLNQEKANFIFSFDDLKISDFILNADTGYFFVGLSRANGLSFDLNKDFSAITFFMHDLAHVDLTLNVFRKLREEKFSPNDRSTLSRRQDALKKLQTLFAHLDIHFTEFEKRFIRIALFVQLHETGVSPYQALYDFQHNPREVARSTLSQIKGSATFQKPIQKEFELLKDDPTAPDQLAKILLKFITFREP